MMVLLANGLKLRAVPASLPGKTLPGRQVAECGRASRRRWAAAASFAFAVAQASASPDLQLVRGGVGITGAPQQLSGTLDTNGNGRGELLVAGREHVSIIEEDDSVRGFRELARLDWDGPLAFFRGAQLIELADAEPALLLNWYSRLELRDASSLEIKATLDYEGVFDKFEVADIDGDGQPEIVTGNSRTIHLLDPRTLASRGSFQIPDEAFTVADILGDARAEVVTGDGRAFTVTRSGDSFLLTEVWNAGVAGRWFPYAVEWEGHAALVLHSWWGHYADLVTFHPTLSIRPLVPDGLPRFTPLFADANGDGRIDLVAAESFHLTAIDMSSGAILWERDTTHQEPYLGTAEYPVASDLDGDGAAELAWAGSRYASGVVAVSVPPFGGPRWRSDFFQSQVSDWTLIERADGSSSIAYLTRSAELQPWLSTIGFVDGSTFDDEGGSANEWLPGYDGLERRVQQNGIASLAVEGQSDIIVVAGTEHPTSGGHAFARWLWTFDASGSFLAERALASDMDPQRIVAAQVLDRAERQIVVAGPIAPARTTARVDILDYASGQTLWQSAPLPGGGVTKLDVVDVDADGELEIVINGVGIAIFKPSASHDAVVLHDGWKYSLLDRGAGRNALLATLRGVNDVAVYEGLSVVPDKTFHVDDSISVALFAQAPEDVLMLVTGDYSGLAVRRYIDGETVATTSISGGMDLAALDIDGDHRVEIVGWELGFAAWRFDNDYIFRDSF